VLVSSVGFALTYASVLAMDLHRGIAGSASALLGTAQYALGAVTARSVGFGNKTAGTALAYTVVGAALIAVLGLWMAVRPGPGRTGSAVRSPEVGSA
jgi:DHA1 family bicyclomycin/chloramphenicol resistance-like MFS transporter